MATAKAADAEEITDKLPLPKSFYPLREGQRDFLVKAPKLFQADDPDNPDARAVVGLDAPTGFGKSVIGKSLRTVLGVKRSLILTANKGLETQYETDFGGEDDGGLVRIDGRNNYNCTHYMNCDVGKRAHCPSVKSGECRFERQVSKAKQANEVLSNYHFWLANNTVGRADIGEFDVLVLDEGHEAHSILDSFFKIDIEVGKETDQIHPKKLNTEEKYTTPGWDNQDLQAWATWALVAYWALKTFYVKEVIPSNDAERVIEYSNRLRNLARVVELYRGGAEISPIAIVVENAKGEPVSKEIEFDHSGYPSSTEKWVVDFFDNKFTFRPVWHKESAEVLFQSVPNILIMSATLRRKDMTVLGLKEGQYKFVEAPSLFDPDRYPIICIPHVNYREGMDESLYRMWLGLIATICRNYEPYRGVIHSISYRRKDMIVEKLVSSGMGGRVTTHYNAGGIPQAIKEHSSKPGSILVSPSVMQGFDFPGDICRFQIMPKIPFLQTGSMPVLYHARQQEDPSYMNYLAAQKMVQAIPGRGMRGMGDWCHNYLTCAKGTWFPYADGGSLTPGLWLKAYRKEEVVPMPRQLGVDWPELTR